MKKVLVADDDPNMRQALIRAVGFWGFGHAAIDNFADLAAVAALENPDVILLKLVLPVYETIELLNALRSCELTTYIHVIILTENNDVEIKQECLDGGAFDVVNGRWSLEDLRDRINEALRQEPRNFGGLEPS